MILSHARLPIPTLPQQLDYTIGNIFAKQNQLWNMCKYEENFDLALEIIMLLCAKMGT